jgi:hypothetical protein
MRLYDSGFLSRMIVTICAAIGVATGAPFVRSRACCTSYLNSSATTTPFWAIRFLRPLSNLSTR